MALFKWVDAAIDHASEAIFTLALLGFVVALNHEHAVAAWGVLVNAAGWLVSQIP